MAGVFARAVGARTRRTAGLCFFPRRTLTGRRRTGHLDVSFVVLVETFGREDLATCAGDVSAVIDYLGHLEFLFFNYNFSYFS